MSDTDDMRGPWALALGMAGIALATVGASALRRLARNRKRAETDDRADRSSDRTDDADP